jgi:serine/threonine-protein kinase
MGSVWLADHLALDIPCAIKFIDREQNSPDARRRFEREAKAAAQLRGQHVVQILDHGVWEGIPYIAMEYLDGEDLGARLDRIIRLAPAQTVRIVSQVAKGLARAHAAGIVHRDLKPENIFLTKDGDDEVVKVLDFGIAKQSQAALSEAGTKTGSLLGTPFYMSPEQARGVKAIDHRSDLFSLAIIVYQCVTGRLPFYSEGLGDVLAQIMYEPIPVPSQHADQIPPAFDAWWKRAASRPVEERFQTAKDLADSLALALGISSAIDVPALEPRVREPSSTDLSGARLPMPPMAATQAVAPSAPRPPEHKTIDRPFVRTFDPTPATGGSRRKKAVVFGAGGAAVLLAALLGIFAMRSAPEATGKASTSHAAGGIAAVAGEPPRGASAPPDKPAAEAPVQLDESDLSQLPAHGDIAGRAAGSPAPPNAGVPPSAPRKKAKPAKGSGSKRDYGI